VIILREPERFAIRLYRRKPERCPVKEFEGMREQKDARIKKKVLRIGEW